MMRVFRSICAGCVLFSSSALLFAQTPAKPAFEVASVKRSAPLPTLMAQIRSGTVRPGMTVSGNRFDCQMSLDSLIASAYRIKRDQIAGPDWLSSQRLEIHATIPEGTSKDQVPEMIQTLLEERFKLKAHIENKEQPVYALVVSKEGSKLMNADDVSDAGATPIGGGPMSIKREGDSFIIFDPRTGMVMRGGKGGRGSGTMRTEILKTSMPAFAEYLTPFVDHPVVDATGLKSSYKMTMELPMEVYRNAIMNRPVPSDLASFGATPFSRPATTVPSTDAPAGNASDPSGRAVFKAVEKLGLKLDSRKAPIETLIIEHVDKDPTEN
jgi:uncharacterized protein (TIGR03435 family)